MAGKLQTRVLTGVLCASVLAALWVSAPPPQTALAAAAFLASPAAALGAAGQALAAESPAPPAAPQPEAQPPLPTEDAAAPAPAPESQAPAEPEAPTPVLPAAPGTDPALLAPLPDEAVPEGMAPLYQRFYTQDAGGQTVACGAGTIKNCTDLTNAEVAAEVSGPLPFNIELHSAAPQVLIMHTHATETYELEEHAWTDPAASARTTDSAVNMVAVGAAMAQVLNDAGICTVQDTTLHDYPSYTGSYANSNATVRKYLEQYPSIKVVLDVHRDAIGGQDGSRTKPVFTWNGLKCAQVMIICGADNGGNLPNFRQNLRFAARWQDAMATATPGLARPVLFDYRYYNQDLTTGSLLIEVGSHGNTLDEALRGGELAARALAALLAGG